MISTFQQVLETVANYPVRTVAVVAPEKVGILQSLKQAMDNDIARPLLTGTRTVIEPLADEVGLDLDGVELLDATDDLQAARLATLAVREGRADLLMKGHIYTDDFLRAILDKETGLRSGHIMSHVFILESIERGRLTFITDGAMNIAPDLTTKAAIIMNAVYLARSFGIHRPKVGVLAAVEVVNPAMAATLDAAALATMETRHQFPDCVVDGPFALDNAISPEAAQVKGLGGEVAGNCDILVVPNIEAGNMLAKSFAFMGGGRVAGVLVGASAPVVLTSRADSVDAKLHSIAAAVLMANINRCERLKIGKVQY
jgi:phosphate butyryltransferase